MKFTFTLFKNMGKTNIYLWYKKKSVSAIFTMMYILGPFAKFCSICRILSSLHSPPQFMVYQLLNLIILVIQNCLTNSSENEQLKIEWSWIVRDFEKAVLIPISLAFAFKSCSYRAFKEFMFFSAPPCISWLS